jgi:hypothetical protein
MFLLTDRQRIAPEIEVESPQGGHRTTAFERKESPKKSPDGKKKLSKFQRLAKKVNKIRVTRSKTPDRSQQNVKVINLLKTKQPTQYELAKLDEIESMDQSPTNAGHFPTGRVTAFE